MNTNLEDLFGYELHLVIGPKDKGAISYSSESLWIGLVSDHPLSIAEFKSTFKTKRIKGPREIISRMWVVDIPPLLASFIAERSSLILITKDTDLSISQLIDMADIDVEAEEDDYDY